MDIPDTWALGVSQFCSGRAPERGDIWVGLLRIDRKVKSVWKAGVQVGKREEDQVERKPVGEIEIL